MTLPLVLALFVATALAEIVGCWLVLQAVTRTGLSWYWLLGLQSLALFAWLLSLHPVASGRVYAAYGGVYVATALMWLWAVDGVRPSRYDLAGAALILSGAAVIMIGGWTRTGEL